MLWRQASEMFPCQVKVVLPASVISEEHHQATKSRTLNLSFSVSSRTFGRLLKRRMKNERLDENAISSVFWKTSTGWHSGEVQGQAACSRGANTQRSHRGVGKDFFLCYKKVSEAKTVANA